MLSGKDLTASPCKEKCLGVVTWALFFSCSVPYEDKYMDISTAKSTLKSLWDSIEEAYSLTKEDWQEEDPEAMESLSGMKDNLQRVFDMADTQMDTDKQATLCGVATALWQAFGDETRRTRKVVAEFREYTFGRYFEDMVKYIDNLLEGVDYLKETLPCKRCGQKYWVYIPVKSDTSVDDTVKYLKANKQKLRQYNSNAAMEMIYFSGLCDACWQEVTK